MAYLDEKLWRSMAHRLLNSWAQAAERDAIGALAQKGTAMTHLPNHPEYRNQLLAKLSLEDLDLLRPHLKPVQLEIRHLLENANEPIEQVYFADSGFASVVAK